MSTRNGFRCPPDQRHVSCLTCGKNMPDRADKSLHQFCVICNQYYCNLYYPPCAFSGVKLSLISNHRSEVRIDREVVRANNFEFESIRNFLISKKLDSKSVFDFVLDKMEKK